MLTRRKHRIYNWVAVLFLIFFFLLLTINYFSKNKSKTIVIEKNITKPLSFNLSLDQVVQSALQGTKGDYGVVVKNLNNNEVYNLNEHEFFEAGSLYKLWVMATVFQKIQRGELKEDDILTEDIQVLNEKFNIDSNTAELTEGRITLSVAGALKQMVTISHNYAALLLAEKVGLSSVDKFLKDNNFSESRIGTNGESPFTSASDISLFFEKLYKGQLADEQYTKEMIDLLKNQQLNDKLPKYLPEGVTIAHKTGEIDYLSHDGGIVYSPKGDYIIIVLTKSDIPTAANDRISQISKNVYDYFNK